MRILLITSTFPRTEREVLAKWIGELAIRLKNNGVVLDVLAPASRGGPSHRYFGIRVYRFRYALPSWEVLTQDEGAVVKIRQNPFLIALVPQYIFFGLIATFRRMQQGHYDIIHVHWPFPNGIFGLVAKWITSVPLILTFHGAEFSLMRRIPGGKWILSQILKNADVVSANSSFTAGQIRQVLPVRVHTIPFGVSSVFDAREIKKKTTTVKSKTKQILFVGRLIERKGVEYLIAAIPKIRNTFDVRLTIAGDGPRRDLLVNLVKTVGLTKVIHFAGKVNDKELEHLYELADVFVLPAIHDAWGETEGLGVVLLEAMAYQKPVIATSVGGIVDIVKHGSTGLLVEEKNSVALADAIRELFANPKRAAQLAASGKTYAKEYFGWDRIVSQTILMYKNSL